MEQQFAEVIDIILLHKARASRTAQIEATLPTQEKTVIVQPTSAQIIHSTSGQMPKILELTTLTNHIEILCRCKSSEERLFYILYANKKH